jgi:carbohydrate-selective porin OprB
MSHRVSARSSGGREKHGRTGQGGSKSDCRFYQSAAPEQHQLRGRPNDALFGSGLDDQYTLEAYYRLQVAKEFSITPDIQFLINPALHPEEDYVWVFGLRARLSF